MQPENFQGRVGFVELAHFDKLINTSSKTQERGPWAGKNFGVFSPRYS